MSGRRAIAVVLFSVALAACSESSLVELGGRSSGWIGETEAGPVAGAGSTGQEVVRAVEVEWFNDLLGESAVSGEPQAVLAGVVLRSTGPDRYIQATRFEIASILPGLVFADLLPADVVSITSQVVVSSTKERLDDTVYAAFGLWTVEPYSKSRSVGQRGTITIAALQQGPACERFAAGVTAACTNETIGDHATVRIAADSGQTWVWFDESYEYQVFLRGSLENNQPVADFMVRNEVAFTAIADPAARVPSDELGVGDQATTTTAQDK